MLNYSIHIQEWHFSVTLLIGFSVSGDGSLLKLAESHTPVINELLTKIQNLETFQGY